MEFTRAAAFIAAIPKGHWASYKDVAIAAGSERASQAIGQWLRHGGGNKVANVHRVIKSGGFAAEAFAPAGPGIPADAASVRELLRQEGVRIDQRGRANPVQRFAVDRWL